MPTLLHVVGSPRRSEARSAPIAQAYLAAARQRCPDLVVDWWLRFIGIRDVERIRFQLTADPEAGLAAALAAAERAAGASFARGDLG